MLKYKEEAIRQAIALLNQIEVKGIANANRVAVIASLLNNPEEETHGEIQKP